MTKSKANPRDLLKELQELQMRSRPIYRRNNVTL
jgi:hypothetical protein